MDLESTLHNTKKKILFSKIKFYIFCVIFYFLNIFENNFYMVKKRASSGKRHYILPVCNMTCLNLY